MSKILNGILAVVLMVLVSCGGGGGGGNGGGSPGSNPEISSFIIFRMDDPDEKPIMEAEVGEILAIHFCFCDEDTDVTTARFSVYFPPDAAKPFQTVNGRVSQTQLCECWYWGPLIPEPPLGEYMLRLEVKDSRGIWSLPFDLEPFIITQTNSNFDYLTEEKPEMVLKKEELEE
jgi:hypothetical protein